MRQFHVLPADATCGSACLSSNAGFLWYNDLTEICRLLKGAVTALLRLQTAPLWPAVRTTPTFSCREQRLQNVSCSQGLKFPAMETEAPKYQGDDMWSHQHTHKPSAVTYCALRSNKYWHRARHHTTFNFNGRCKKQRRMANDMMEGVYLVTNNSSKVVVNSLTERLGLCTESTWRWRLSLHNAILRSLLKVHHLFVD